MKLTIDTKAEHLKSGFQHVGEYESIEQALDLCVRDLTAAHAQLGKGDTKVAIVIWKDNIPIGDWTVTLTLPVPVRLPCPTCGGEGGMDSGGVTPWGAGIDIPCPSCAPDPAKKPDLKAWTDACRTGAIILTPMQQEEIVRVIERAKCGCLCLDCVKHGAYPLDAFDIFKRITETRKLLPPKQIADRKTEHTIYEANNGQD